MRLTHIVLREQVKRKSAQTAASTLHPHIYDVVSCGHRCPSPREGDCQTRTGRCVQHEQVSLS